MTPTRSTLDTLDVSLPGGRVLRLALYRDAAGNAELLIAAGFPDRVGWNRIMAEGVNLPGEALPDLVRALEALGGGEHVRAF